MGNRNELISQELIKLNLSWSYPKLTLQRMWGSRERQGGSLQAPHWLGGIELITILMLCYHYHDDHRYSTDVTQGGAVEVDSAAKNPSIRSQVSLIWTVMWCDGGDKIRYFGLLFWFWAIVFKIEWCRFGIYHCTGAT